MSLLTIGFSVTMMIVSMSNTSFIQANSVGGLVICVIVLLSGCVYRGWEDVPSAKVRPVISALHAANTGVDNAGYWLTQVETAVNLWNVAMESVGCSALFELSPDDPEAHEVRLLPGSDWPHEKNVIGCTYADVPDRERGYIDILERRPDRSAIPVLLHELGHAAGLPHDEGHDTVMTPKVPDLYAPGETDVRNVGELLGCL